MMIAEQRCQVIQVKVFVLTLRESGKLGSNCRSLLQTKSCVREWMDLRGAREVK